MQQWDGKNCNYKQETTEASLLTERQPYQSPDCKGIQPLATE